MDIAGRGWWWVYPVEDTHTASDRKLSYAGLSTKYERPNRQEYSFLMFRKAFLWKSNSFLMQTLYFVTINLHRCWPRDWKHSIAVYVFIYGKQVCAGPHHTNVCKTSRLWGLISSSVFNNHFQKLAMLLILRRSFQWCQLPIYFS